MTLKDFLSRVNADDIDKMMIFREGKGWSNIDVNITDSEVVITSDRTSPFSDGGIIETKSMILPSLK